MRSVPREPKRTLRQIRVGHHNVIKASESEAIDTPVTRPSGVGPASSRSSGSRQPDILRPDGRFR